ncbi:MAG: hypothetical protein H8D22_12775 [Candidatus Cloacimonetes bacterium]|nr:hypothetical protein [Candidatus Cloacimonadota bacterium]
MEIEDLISIGVIKKAIGNNGFIAVIPETDFPEHFKKLSKIFLVFPDETIQSKTIQFYNISEKNISIKSSDIKNGEKEILIPLLDQFIAR